MREASIRWGLGMGVLASALGVLALVGGRLVAPVHAVGRSVSPESIAFAAFITGIFVLFSLGVALALAYVAGVRAERAALSERTAAGTPAPLAFPHRESVLAGALTLLCYWLITALYMYVLPPFGMPTPLGDYVSGRLVLGLVYLCFGAGMGGIGGRAPAARKLLDGLMVPATPAAPPAAADAAPPPTPVAEANE